MGTNIQTLELCEKREDVFAWQLITIERLSTLWGGYFHLGGSHFFKIALQATQLYDNFESLTPYNIQVNFVKLLT
jgi:hypothetical protein